MNFLQTHGQIFNLNFTYAPKYSNLFMISVSKCFLCNSGDAQFVSATYRLFKVPQDSKTDGSRVTYKGIGYNLNKRVKKWEKREGEKERNISPYPHRTLTVPLLTFVSFDPPLLPRFLSFDFPLFPSWLCDCYKHVIEMRDRSPHASRVSFIYIGYLLAPFVTYYAWEKVGFWKTRKEKSK